MWYSDGVQIQLHDVEVGYAGELPEGEVDVDSCTPTHGSGEVLIIYGHPLRQYEGKFCRTGNWNRAAHFENSIGGHFYYFEDESYRCY